MHFELERYFHLKIMGCCPYEHQICFLPCALPCLGEKKIFFFFIFQIEKCIILTVLFQNIAGPSQEAPTGGAAPCCRRR